MLPRSVLPVAACSGWGQVEDSGTSESSAFGSGEDEVHGPKSGECFGALGSMVGGGRDEVLRCFVEGV
jgi:hypothetical protein